LKTWVMEQINRDMAWAHDSLVIGGGIGRRTSGMTVNNPGKKSERTIGKMTLRNMREHIIADEYVNAAGDRALEEAAPSPQQ